MAMGWLGRREAARRTAALSLVFLLGCVEEALTPERYLVFDQPPRPENTADSADPGTYRLIPSEIRTLDDPRAGRGAVAELRGSGDLVISSETPSSEEDFRRLILVEGARDPDIQFDVREDGVAVPFDYDSVLLLSMYHHLERAAEYFAAIGVAQSDLRTMTVYYSPRSPGLLFIPLPVFTDNAAYVTTLDAFLIPPAFFLSGVPLVANRGVMIHEYSHMVANRLIHQDRRVPRFFVEDWPPAAVNELRSLDEGLADLFAALALRDPDFISASISSELFAIDRDVSVDRFYDAPLRAEVESARDDYNPYVLGSVIASALWDLRPLVPDDVLAPAVIRSMRGLAPVTETFELARFADLLHDELPREAQPDACRLLHQRFEAIAPELACEPE